MFDRLRRQVTDEATAAAPRPRYTIVATAIGGDTWDISIPELLDTSTVALSEHEIEPNARHRIAADTLMQPDDFDVDVRLVPYGAASA